MSEPRRDDPWGDFWAQNANGSSAGEGGGCLPQRWKAIEEAQRAQWLAFANLLAEDARVLDLATGDGRVLRWIRTKRADLSLSGIDLAPRIPASPPGIETRPAIPMENLPFADDAFDAVVSQFGVEYGETQKVAAEIARVLKPGGMVGLMVHRGDGPILEHNRKRRSELLWALKEKGVARKVRQQLNSGAGAIDLAAKFAGKIAQQGGKKFGEASPAWEIPEAIRRSCLMGRRAGVGSIVETIATIENHARNELGRIKSLGDACAKADARAAFLNAFAMHELTVRETFEVHEPSGRSLADFLILR
ncbi:MAG: class I SAM-dependent methyltransferase [Erythrobacter sp.]|uniref:class I SAM-dependent methyltransferase n=1 Tax=Erythrobacter sp. TaxID=1042 RepID=UPI003C73100D